MSRTLYLGMLKAFLFWVYGCAATDPDLQESSALDCTTANEMHACLDLEVREMDGIVYSGIYRYRDEYDVCLLELIPNFQFERGEVVRGFIQRPATVSYAHFGLRADSGKCPPFDDSDSYIRVSSYMDFAAANLVGENIGDWSEYVERNAERPCAAIQGQLKRQIDNIDVRTDERNPAVIIDYRNICFSPEYQNWLRFTVTFDRETQTEIDRQVVYLHE